MYSHNIELPIGLYQHNIVQIKADKILLMGGLMGSSQNVDKNYDIFVMNPFNCKLFILYITMKVSIGLKIISFRKQI